MVKSRGKEERIKRRHKGGGEREDDARAGVGEGEKEEEKICQSCLLIGWRCTENKRQTQPALTFQITLRHTNTHLPTPPPTHKQTHTRGGAWPFLHSVSKKCHLGILLKVPDSINTTNTRAHARAHVQSIQNT